MRTQFPLFRYLLTILIVVLPLQGSAAIVMSYGSGTAMARSMQVTGDATFAAMSAMLAGGHCNHAATPERKAKSSQMKCNASVSCCVGAVAPPSTLAKLPARLLSTEARAAQEPAMNVFIPPTLKRPPRLS